MSHIHAYGLNETPDTPATERSDATPQRVPHKVSVELASPALLSSLQSAWADLLGRVDAPNVFMDPAVVRAAAEADPYVQYSALLAWMSVVGGRQLVGLWAFAVGRPRRSLLPIPMLNGPLRSQSYLATPVVDRDCLEETFAAMLDRIADDPKLPKIVALEMMGTDGPAYGALMRVLALRGSGVRVFEQSTRPKLASPLDGKTYLERSLSSSTRKKLRQHRRRLSEKGAVTCVIVSEPQALRRALDDFLQIEAAGWKGSRGTALANSKADAAFMRGTLEALADRGCASIHSLCLDGRPISMQIVLRAGAAAFTWKTTYDEAFREFSPGTLLLEDYTTTFLADKSITYVDSCSFDDTGFMAAWSERQPVADIWLDARRGGSLTFRVASGVQKNYRTLRNAAKRAVLAWRKSRKR